MSEGTVKWFNQRRGYGFILTPDGREIFVHYSNIAGHGFKTLGQGEQVTFEIVQGQKGLRAENVVQKSAPVRRE
jgi:CspA family cold shock protein